VQRLRELMAHGGIATLAIVFALAFAVFDLAQSVSGQVVFAIQQQGRDEDGGFLDLGFTIADTRIHLADVLLNALTLVLLALALLGVWKLTRRAARVCPECRSSVPVAASVCRFCTTEFTQPRVADA
jgi:GAF domain-containing protein